MFASIFAQLNRQSQHTRLLQHITKKKNIYNISKRNQKNIGLLFFLYFITQNHTSQHVNRIATKKKSKSQKADEQSILPLIIAKKKSEETASALHNCLRT